jgi:hypothetical protein
MQEVGESSDGGADLLSQKLRLARLQDRRGSKDATGTYDDGRGGIQSSPVGPHRTGRDTESRASNEKASVRTGAKSLGVRATEDVSVHFHGLDILLTLPDGVKVAE